MELEGFFHNVDAKLSAALEDRGVEYRQHGHV